MFYCEKTVQTTWQSVCNEEVILQNLEKEVLVCKFHTIKMVGYKSVYAPGGELW